MEKGKGKHLRAKGWVTIFFGNVGESVDPIRGYNVSSVNQQDVNIRRSTHL